ncbi:MAG: C25 family cysteine peptidase, partial [Saprospiraceae bacterium]
VRLREQGYAVHTVTVQTGTPQVTLDWDNGADTAGILIIRRVKDAPDWFVLLDEAATATTTFTDTNVAAGMTYEYGIQRLKGGIYAYGYATVPIEAPLTDSRGKVLIFVEEALQLPLAMELDRLDRDLTGDGWQVIWHPVDTAATITTVKSQIVADYDTDTAGVKTVLLLGEIPVPYSGNTNWDGHANHQGAWPADTWYGDVDGNWTDTFVNNTSPSRPENDNVPGDGKFDQSITPSPLEIAVGRVDFSNLSEANFGTTQLELYRRYLNKNHNWRTKQYTVANKALVDDNFGYFGGEAFGANGWRNANPLVGTDSVMAADFFGDTDGEGFLMGYGCGGGSYTSASGIGNSTQFGTDSVNIVFSMLFGSYHGDWDYSPNPFMPSALASKGGILSCSWAGRPHWFYHHLAAGQTLGYCALSTQNSCGNNGYFGSIGTCGAHATLLGDPTLRAQIVAPATGLAAVNKCSSVELNWTASAAPGLMGYHVYRSTAQNGEYERLTTALVTDTFFEDESPAEDTLYYQVRAVVLENTPSGSFYNNSTGVFTNTIFAFGDIPNVDFVMTTIDCDGFADVTFSISGGTPPYSYIIDPFPPFPPGASFSATISDAGGCNVTVMGINTAQPSDLETSMAQTNETVAGANDGTATAQPTGGIPPYEYLWSDGQTTQTAANLAPGDYGVTVTDAIGCTSTGAVTIEAGVNAAEEIPGLLSLQLFPNPTAGLLSFEFSMEKQMEVDMALLDVTGRLLQKVALGTAAHFNGNFEMGKYPPGVYLLKIRLNGRMVSRRVVKTT